MIQDFMGNQSGYKGVTTRDIPSDMNKVYNYRLDDDGGLSPRQGIFANQVSVSRAETETPDNPLAGKDVKSWVTIAVALGLLYVIFKVLK